MNNIHITVKKNAGGALRKIQFLRTDVPVSDQETTLPIFAHGLWIFAQRVIPVSQDGSTRPPECCFGQG